MKHTTRGPPLVKVLENDPWKRCPVWEPVRSPRARRQLRVSNRWREREREREREPPVRGCRVLRIAHETAATHGTYASSISKLLASSASLSTYTYVRVLFFLVRIFFFFAPQPPLRLGRGTNTEAHANCFRKRAENERNEKKRRERERERERKVWMEHTEK